MIYPTRTAVIAALLGAPFALLVAIIAPSAWHIALLWPLVIMLLCLIDSVDTRGEPLVEAHFPESAFVGNRKVGEIHATLPGQPGRAEVVLASSALVGLTDDGRELLELSDDRRHGSATFQIDMLRRGTVHYNHVWLRWTGRLGMIWRQHEVAIDQRFPILPDLLPVRQHAMELVQRFSREGQIQQLTRGDGSDFDSLVEFKPGMDHRAIDWKQSAKNIKLLAKLYHGERSNQILFAIDCGRTMCDPVGGLARIDRAIAATLLTAWVALKLGDRVSLYSFDSRPRVTTGMVTGSRAFAAIRRAAAQIDYSTYESNYSFALSQLSARLVRRSMIVLFSEIGDEASADFLIRALRPLVARHIVVAIIFKDDELNDIASGAPRDLDDVTRSVTASSLLKDRAIIIGRLRRLGVDVVESEFDKVDANLAQTYLKYKQRSAI